MTQQEMFARLRQPFADEAIKWKIQTNPAENDTFALCVAYIDARDVAARLNEVVGLDWESSFSDLIAFSDGKKGEWGVQCRLTVMGHTRTDIGTLSATEPLKGGYSDALKRAAVQFGIAAYVYAFPIVKAEVQKYGRSYYFTPNAKKELVQLARLVHSSAQSLPKFYALKVRDYAPIRFDSPYFGGGEETNEAEVQVERPGDDLQQAIVEYNRIARKAVDAGVPEVPRLTKIDDLQVIRTKGEKLHFAIVDFATELHTKLNQAPEIWFPDNSDALVVWIAAIEEMQEIIKAGADVERELEEVTLL